MRIAMLYIAEAYQVYHGHAVALALAKIPGVDVTVFYNDTATPHHIARIERSFGHSGLPARRLRRGVLGAIIQAPKLLGMAKPQVLDMNLEELLGFDAIVSLEHPASRIHDRTDGKHPPLILIPHGAGDRNVTWCPSTAAFDLLLLSGEKTARRFESLGLTKPGGVAVPGCIKLETTARLGRSLDMAFETDRPIVLFNPHKEPRQTSWRRAIEPMLSAFEHQSDYNLIVAPHVKMFRRRSQRLRDAWADRSRPNIHIDPGSDNCVDGSYADIADIYVGDVSSQVYEFTVKPRPCVFLNMHGAEWRDNPEYLFWEMGEVVDDPVDIMPAIRRARDLHPQYIERQRQLTESALGNLAPGAARRAADAIVDFVRTRGRSA